MTVADGPPDSAGPQSGMRTLDRVVDLLLALADDGEPVTAAALAERTNLPLSSTYRLIQGLEHRGLVSRQPRGGVALGLRVLDLAQHVATRIDATIVRPVRPIMEGLAAATGETVLLTAPVGVSAIGLASIVSPRSIALSFAHWRLSPMHRGASSKVLLAFLESEAAEEVLRQASTSNPQLDQAALRRDLAKIRKRGYAVTHGELDPGASAVAAPIRDERGSLLAGLAVAGPTPRMRQMIDELAAAVPRRATVAAEAIRAHSSAPAAWARRD